MCGQPFSDDQRCHAVEQHEEQRNDDPELDWLRRPLDKIGVRWRAAIAYGAIENCADDEKVGDDGEAESEEVSALQLKWQLTILDQDLEKERQHQDA